MKVNIQNHTQVDKSFDMMLEEMLFAVRFDYDDVDHAENSVLVYFREFSNRFYVITKLGSPPNVAALSFTSV